MNEAQTNTIKPGTITMQGMLKHVIMTRAEAAEYEAKCPGSTKYSIIADSIRYKIVEASHDIS